MSYIIKMALDIKARFEPPAPMTSPLEAYCAIGTIARAMKNIQYLWYFRLALKSLC